MWDLDRSVVHLNEHAEPHSLGRCAKYVRQAIEAGGVTLVRHKSAKDYGASLERVGFHAVSADAGSFAPGDVAVVQPIPGHPHGHMAMFNGSHWVSDFKQLHGYYPGPSYRSVRPPVVIYRHAVTWAAPPFARGNHTMIA